MVTRLFILVNLIICGLSSEEVSPRIVIVGCGASGIAAASRLLQNGFNDITILEAENRIGGRVYSVQLGDYLVDLGGEWVVGEKNNAAFQLAWPLGLLEKSADQKELDFTLKYFDSDGEEIPADALNPMLQSILGGLESMDENVTGSVGKVVEKDFDEYVKSHSEINPNLHKPLLHFLDVMRMSDDGGATWGEVSAKGIQLYDDCEGDPVINWKDRTYATILDIIMKKYPNPEEELPIKNKTKLNTKVTQIKYDENPIKVITSNGEKYSADHVIVTPSLGVLQKHIDELFNPPLPEKKANAIKNLSFGGTAKIILYYDDPWWLNDPIQMRGIVWTEEDRKEIENDPQKRWMLGIPTAQRVEHKPKMMILWVAGPYLREMELLPEEIFQEHVKEFVKRFFGKVYNVTEPKIIKRTLWNTSENFLGVYSFRGMQAEKMGVRIEDYAEPIMKSEKPVLQFAGEATSSHFGMVHGGIDSGWREADRLIDYYNKKSQ